MRFGFNLCLWVGDVISWMLGSLNLWVVFITIVVLVLGMRILSWNCRGAGRAPTVRALKALVHKESPDIIFISES